MDEFTGATTWAQVRLDEILTGEYTPVVPSLLARIDGRCLLYRERVHALHAEPESLKSWLSLKACCELLRDFERVLYIDFEDSAPSIVQRLLSLGANPEAIADSFIYIRPDEALGVETYPDLQAALEQKPALAVIDGVTESYARQGLNPSDNNDIAAWLELLPRQLVRAGAAVLMPDHVTKDRESRGRWAIGGQHKLAGIDLAYSLRVVEPFAPGRDGLVSIRVEKDRPGHVREFAVDGRVALLRARSLPDGQVRLDLEPPEQAAGGFRPTGQMERISLAIEANAGLSKRAIRGLVSGKATVIDLALELLVSEKFVDARRDGQKHLHYSIRPFREEAHNADRVPVSDRVPNVSGTRSPNRVPVSPALTGTRTREATALETTLDRVPLVAGEESPPGDDEEDPLDALIARHRNGS